MKSLGWLLGAVGCCVLGALAGPLHAEAGPSAEVGRVGAEAQGQPEADPVLSTLQALRDCDLKAARLGLWGLSGEQANEFLQLARTQGIADQRLEVAVLARIGGRDAAAVGLALMGHLSATPATEDVLLLAELESARHADGKALELYRAARATMSAETPIELRYRAASRLTELYLFHTATVERALPHLREAIGLAHDLDRDEEIGHLQELQQLFALQYSRFKARPDALRFRPVESYQGLLGSESRAIVKQADGLWILDSGGAIHFDGIEWKAYPSEQTFGWTALIGSDGAFYATPINGGLARLANGQWSLLEEPKGYEVNRVTSMLERDGWLYLAGDWRLARIHLDGSGLEEIPLKRGENERIRGIDRQGDRLVATTVSNLYFEDAGAWTPAGPGLRLPDDASLGMSLVDGDTIWLPTSRGVFRWRGDEWDHYTVANGLPVNEMSYIYRLSDGTIFASTYLAEALARFDGESWQSAADPTSALAIARAPDRLLVATAGGLLQGPSERWRILDSRSGLPGDRVEYVLRLGDETWALAHTKGVMRVRADGFEAYGMEDGLPPLTQFMAMARDGDHRWLGTQHGLFRMEGSHFVEVPLAGKIGKELFSLSAAGNGELLVGTTEGLLLLKGDGKLEEITMPSPVARAIVSYGADRFLVATEEAGLVSLRRGPDGSLKLENTWNKAGGLCSDLAQAIWADPNGELWVGTDSGLAHGTPEPGGAMKWRCLTEADGLPAHDITAITRLASGRLAVGFFLVGVGLYDGQSWSLFGAEDGRPSQSIWSILEREPGVIWVGTAQGIWEIRVGDAAKPRTYFELDRTLYTAGENGQPCAIGRLLDTTETPPLKIRIGRSDYAPVETVAGSGCTEGRPAGRLDLTAIPEIRAIGQSRWGFEDPEALWYSLRVDGAEAGPFTKGTTLHLPELSDGPHRIEVVAKNRYLEVDDRPIAVEMDLDRPIPPWVWISSLASAALLVYLLRAQLRDAFLRLRHLRFKPIPRNPYSPNAPAAGELFVGRTDLVDRWLAPLQRAEPLAECRLLLGPLSLGKTSSLAELHRRASAAGQLSVLANLAEWMQESFPSFVAALREKLDAAVKAAGITQPDGSDGRGATAESPLRLLDQDLEGLGKIQPRRRVFLLVDNFQLLDQLLAMNDIPLQQVLLALRSMLQRHTHLSLVLAFAGQPESLKGRYGELFFFSSLDALALLPSDATERLSTVPLSGHAYLAPQAIAAAHLLSGGHPALLQTTLHHLVEELGRVKSNVCDPRLVRDAVPALLQQARVLEGWWQGLSRPQQLVLSRLAERTEEGQSIDVEAFTEAESNRMALLPQEARKALHACIETLLLTGDERQVRWSAELFRLWVRERQPFKMVLERERIQMGPYELLSKIGQGGMGAVYRARHLTGGDIVAVKVLHAGALEDQESRHRFFREAEIGIRLKHNNIVAIYEKGELGEQAYIAMEFLQGTTLRSYLQDKGPMKGANAMKILRAVADALRAIHELGVIHRDIKTENIFLQTPEGSKKTVPKLMDFGLARSEASRVTRTGVIVGTVAYMSPEQALGQKLGPGTDLYSLGVVLFEMLTGQMPFTGASDVAILSQVVNRPPPDIRELRPDIPDGLATLLLQLLAKEAAARPESAAKLVEKLDELLGTPTAPAAEGEPKREAPAAS